MIYSKLSKKENKYIERVLLVELHRDHGEDCVDQECDISRALKVGHVAFALSAWDGIGARSELFHSLFDDLSGDFHLVADDEAASYDQIPHVCYTIGGK